MTSGQQQSVLIHPPALPCFLLWMIWLPLHKANERIHVPGIAGFVQSGGINLP